jgi:hypothetical protein
VSESGDSGDWAIANVTNNAIEKNSADFVHSLRLLNACSDSRFPQFLKRQGNSPLIQTPARQEDFSLPVKPL